jgi:hypothetical protein
LGYASTINAAQGMTAGGRDLEGTCHTVISDRLTRQQLYVAGTRGRTENHFYGSTAEADPHRILAPKATHPPSTEAIVIGYTVQAFRERLGLPGCARSNRASRAHDRLRRRAGPRYQAQQHIGPDRLDVVEPPPRRAGAAGHTDVVDGGDRARPADRRH